MTPVAVQMFSILLHSCSVIIDGRKQKRGLSTGPTWETLLYGTEVAGNNQTHWAYQTDSWPTVQRLTVVGLRKCIAFSPSEDI